MPLRLEHLPYLKTKDPRLYETIVALRNGMESLAKQAGIGIGGNITPPTIQSITVSAANGIFHVSIIDKSTTHFGINYFVEYADNPVFNNAKSFFLGPNRDIEGWNLGSRTLYFRAFSQYLNSVQSPRVVFGGSTPTAVVGGGSAPPPILSTSGSGTGFGGGFGGKDPRVR